jgi:formate dehydrogenase gamma subunit
MSNLPAASESPASTIPSSTVKVGRIFPRFTLAQRWEHALLFLSFLVLFLTGLPQKYRTASWSQQILATPEQLELVQTIHHIAAVVLILEVLYHLGRAVVLMARRSLPADIFVNWQDFKDAGQMVSYLLFLRKEKPLFGKYNFEQKFTYWLTFLWIGILVVSGLIIWFPEDVTRVLPGGVVPAAKMAHSTEAIVAAIFIIIWHFYHVHLERFNLSMFNGNLTEEEMQTYHTREYQRLTGNIPGETAGQPEQSSGQGGGDPG